MLRFNGKAFDSSDLVVEYVLVDVCLHSIIEDYGILLENFIFLFFF